MSKHIKCAKKIYFHYIVIIDGNFSKMRSLFPSLVVSIFFISNKYFFNFIIFKKKVIRNIILIVFKKQILKPIKLIKIIASRVSLFFVCIKININIYISLYEKIEHRIDSCFTYHCFKLYIFNHSFISYLLIKNVQILAKTFSVINVVCNKNSHFKYHYIHSQHKHCYFYYFTSLFQVNSSIQFFGSCILTRNQLCKVISVVYYNSFGTSSTQKYNQIIHCASYGSFCSYVVIPKYLKKIFSSQVSRNILLDNKSYVVAKPMLYINSDDILCSHGVTVGNLNQVTFYYFMNRGIDINNIIYYVIVGILNSVFSNCIVNVVEKKMLYMQVTHIV